MEIEIITIEEEQPDRYSRLKLAGWQPDILRKAHVLVAGAGALGNEVSKNLALLGLGHILIVDFDRIEITNLSRSVLFRETDIGRFKAQVAAQRIQELNSEIEVEWFNGDLAFELGSGVFRRMDLAFGCLDNRAARLAVNRHCWLTNTPWVDGALNGMDGLVRVFIPGQGACYECTLTSQDYQDLGRRFSCTGLQRKAFSEGLIPTTPTSASLIAAVQVEKAIRLLHHTDVPVGYELVYSSALSEMDKVRLKEKADCMSHERADPLIELPWARASITTAGEILKEAQRHLGELSVLELNHEILVALHCPNCHQVERCIAPFHQFEPAALNCPVCGAERIPTSTHRIDQETDFLALPLAQVGIPPGDILRVRSGNKLTYLELSGDLQNSPRPNKLLEHSGGNQ